MTFRFRIPSIVRRGFAVFLGFLIVTPFTAPFSSCPLTILLNAPADRVSASPGIELTASLQDDTLPSDAFSIQIEEKLKDESVLQPVTVDSIRLVVSIAEGDMASARVSAPPVVSFVLRI